MIKEISKDNLSECAKVIKESFLTVAREFNITEQNAPRYVAFATTEEKISEQYDNGRKMYAYFDNDKIVGFYALEFYGVECELNNLCVSPEYRHRGIAKELLKHSFNVAKQNGATKMNISIVEENRILKDWYIGFGFKPTYTEKYDFFPFTCGYMEKNLIDFFEITACGKCCANCQKKIDNLCKGCIETDGYVPERLQSGRCKVHSCTRKHGVRFCGLCSEFPCKNLTTIIHWNSSIVEHLTDLRERYYSSVDNCINDISDSSMKIIALNFVGFLNDNKMFYEKAGGYWNNQQYFYVKFKGEFVCYILLNGKEDEDEFYPFTVWSDDSNSNWYGNANLDENTKSIAIKHIDICENCGACSGGMKKQIFGNQYNNVCRTTFRFVNPNIDELECLKKLVLLRKNDIDRGLNDIKGILT